MHTQLRAVCPECFNEQAIKRGVMVDHGYTIPHDWHQRNGSCGGVRAPHFGTVAGREHTEAYRERMQQYIATQRALLADVPNRTTIMGNNGAGSVIKFGRLVRPDDVELTAANGHWFTDAKASLIQVIQFHIKSAVDFVKYLDGQLAGWALKEPRAVEIDTAPTLHAQIFRNGVGAVGVMCSSGWGSRNRYFNTTDDASKVTCARCIKALASRGR